MQKRSGEEALISIERASWTSQPSKVAEQDERVTLLRWHVAPGLSSDCIFHSKCPLLGREIACVASEFCNLLSSDFLWELSGEW